MATLLSQYEIIDRLAEDNFDVSIRNLRYWRDLGELPPLKFINGNFVYDELLLPLIKNICYKRGKAKSEILMIYQLEGESFDIWEERTIKVDGKFIHFLESTDCTFVQINKERYVRES